MKKYTALKISILTAVVLLTFLVAGCGGGGGGGANPVAPGVDLSPNSVVAPGTATLASGGSFYTYNSNSANVSLKVPVDNATARFALVITNPNTGSNLPKERDANTALQTIRIMPESYVLGTARSAALVGSVAADDYHQRQLNQAPLEQRLRVLASQRASIPGVMASRSLRAADHSAEQLGDIVQLRIVGDTFGYTYITRDCKLRRMSENCKLFVDQGEYQGLSAVDGINAVTEVDLDHLINEFETHIHNLLLNSYGPVYDIDNDGRVSILISPVYSKLGFAGLFNSNNFANNSNSNLRDLISLFSPEVAKNWTGERWREATRETIAHEMQHLVNYSANMHFNSVGAMEEEWLDESLSVGVEARYRMRRSSPLIENRFKLWAQSPSNVGLLNFSRALSQYGMVGLFNFFLYEQSDDATIKSMVNSTVLGKNNVDRLFSAKGGLNGMFKTWAMAALMDTLSKQGAVNLSQINASYKYQNAIGLDVKYTSVNFGYKTDVLTLPAYGAAFYVLEQPASFGQNEYRFRIESEEGKNIDIVMVRLP